MERLLWHLKLLHCRIEAFCCYLKKKKEKDSVDGFKGSFKGEQTILHKTLSDARKNVPASEKGMVLLKLVLSNRF